MDIYLKIGQKIREKRKKAGITLEEISKFLHVTYQQIQKYENGQSRVPVARLYEVATLLNTPIQYFFEGVSVGVAADSVPGRYFIAAEPDRALNIFLIDGNPVDEFFTRRAISEIDKEINVFCVQNEMYIMPALKKAVSEEVFPIPDLIFLDIKITRQYADTIMEIKREKFFQEIPVIVLTNSLSVEDLLKVYRYGAAGFISKTENFDLFKNKMKTCLEYWGKTVVLPRITRDNDKTTEISDKKPSTSNSNEANNPIEKRRETKQEINQDVNNKDVTHQDINQKVDFGVNQHSGCEVHQA